MGTLRIEIPETFIAENAKNIINILSSSYIKSMTATVDKVVFDFSKSEEISPVGLLYIKMWRDELNERGKTTYYKKSDKAIESYLRKMRLLPGLGKYEEEQVAKEFFYSIHLCNNGAECGDAQKEIISNVVQRGKVKDTTYSSVDYMLNELWDNAGAHGYGCYDSLDYPKPIYMCALEYDDHFEISIGDRGQGIYSSLNKKNPNIKNNRQALISSIENGVSGHPNGSPGFGLFCSAEFIRKGQGNLSIWSSGCHLAISSANDKIYTSNFNCGTLINITFNKTADMPFEEIVGTYETNDYIEEMIGGMFDE